MFAALAASSVAAEPRLRLGVNVTGSTYGVDSIYFPPDSDGAVGRRHIVELINGRYAVYSKKDGTRVQSESLQQFWTDAGATVHGLIGDPRVVFDPLSRRWFASTGGFNFGNGPDDLLLAVSKSADPTQGWSGFTIPFAGPTGTALDFPTLAFDRDGVFLYASGTLLVVPKSDLLASSPSVARATLLQSSAFLTPTGSVVQPVLSLDPTGLPERLLGAWDVAGTVFRRWSIGGSVTAPTLDASDAFIPVSQYRGLGNQGALQRDSGTGISTGSQRFSSSLVLRNDVIWGVQTVATHGRAAVRWFAIDAHTDAVFQEGLIADATRDVFMASIAVNACDDVVLGFNESGPSEYVSAYAVAGTTTDNVTTFGEPILLKAGAARYDETGGEVNARWGDYSATVVDPAHPLKFWTFQEWPSAPNVWSTQITELKLIKSGRAHDEAEEDDRKDEDGLGIDETAKNDAGCRAR